MGVDLHSMTPVPAQDCDSSRRMVRRPTRRSLTSHNLSVCWLSRGLLPGTRSCFGALLPASTGSRISAIIKNVAIPVLLVNSRRHIWPAKRKMPRFACWFRGRSSFGGLRMTFRRHPLPSSCVASAWIHPQTRSYTVLCSCTLGSHCRTS